MLESMVTERCVCHQKGPESDQIMAQKMNGQRQPRKLTPSPWIIRQRAARQSRSPRLLHSRSPPWHPFPVKSFALPVRISCDSSFLSVRQELTLTHVWLNPFAVHRNYHNIVNRLRWWFSCSVVSDSCDPMDCSPPGSSVHRIFQARILEWVAISFSRDLPDLGIDPCLRCRQTLYRLSYQGRTNRLYSNTK